MPRIYQNREEAGQALAEALKDEYAERPDTLILALPRGGLPVACEVADALSLPLDLWLVRKIGTPGHEELAMGALAANGVCHVNRDIVMSMNVNERLFDRAKQKAAQELENRNRLYREGTSPPKVKGKTVILVDDGLATGATMLAAIYSLREEKAEKIIVAVPVGAHDSCRKIAKAADRLICLHEPSPFFGVGQWYRDFSQVSDEEVAMMLSQHHAALDSHRGVYQAGQ